MAKQKRKMKRSFVKAISIIVIGVSIYLLFGVGREIYSVISLKNQADLINEELESLKAEHESLMSKRDKLSDPDYVQTYARGNYMFSKDGEKVFYLPGDKNPTSTPDSE